ncbi:malate dehydrogenase [Salmonella enterica]|uniref:PD-(D/E)XK nuclease domain-containing protein n=1 Tax=Salmonella enterica TaxID=28901 RepID=UPI0015FF29AA|nr:malate dehydrogenase [Salmonella enterica]
MMKKRLEERFEALEQDYHAVISTKYMGRSALGHGSQEYIDSAKGNYWIVRVKKLLEDSYGKESDYYKDFNDTKKIAWSSNYQSLVRHYKPIFDAAREDLAHSVTTPTVIKDKSELDLIINILNKFPAFCRQLKKRYNDRTPLEINDEYDVQDLVHALLLLHFDDVRPEEASPSYAGSSSRQDFLLKKEKIVIEVKKTRRSLGTGKIGEELIIDMARYRAHPDCDTLVCFVYDPDGWVNNPKGVIDDLEGGDAEGKTKVVIAQF